MVTLRDADSQPNIKNPMKLQTKAVLNCSSAQELEHRIKELRAQFPNPTAKDNDERLVLYTYLRERASEWRYPIRVVHQDRPDFVLFEGDEAIGCECVKLTTQSLEQGLSITDADFSVVPRDTTKLLVTQNMDKPQILDTMLGEQAIPTFVPNADLESTWLGQLINCIEGKTCKAKDYSAARIHLLVSDRLSFNESDTIDRVEKFSLTIRQAVVRSGKFECVFVAGISHGVVFKYRG